jgi:hypothetical protein
VPLRKEILQYSKNYLNSINFYYSIKPKALSDIHESLLAKSLHGYIENGLCCKVPVGKQILLFFLVFCINDTAVVEKIKVATAKIIIIMK